MSGWEVVGHLLHAGVVGVGLVGVAALQAPRVADALGVLRTPHDPHHARVTALRQRAATGTLATPAAAVALVPGAAATRGAGPSAPATRTQTWLPVAAVSSAAAGGVHLAVAPLHADEPALAALFVLAAAAQVLWALAALGGLGGRARALAPVSGVLVAAACLAAWAASRTAGLPLGLHGGVPQPVGAWDLAAAAWTACALLWGVVAWRADARTPRRTPSGPAAEPAWSTGAWGWLGGCAVALVVLTTSGAPA